VHHIVVCDMRSQDYQSEKRCCFFLRRSCASCWCLCLSTRCSEWILHAFKQFVLSRRSEVSRKKTLRYVLECPQSEKIGTIGVSLMSVCRDIVRWSFVKGVRKTLVRQSEARPLEKSRLTDTRGPWFSWQAKVLTPFFRILAPRYCVGTQGSKILWGTLYERHSGIIAKATRRAYALVMIFFHKLFLSWQKVMVFESESLSEKPKKQKKAARRCFFKNKEYDATWFQKQWAAWRRIVPIGISLSAPCFRGLWIFFLINGRCTDYEF
jgi:hypothetical protein